MLSWKSAGRGIFIETECGRYLINRANTGGRLCYMAVRGGKNGTADDILHVERDIDPACDAGRLAAVDRCKAACEVFDTLMEVPNG